MLKSQTFRKVHPKEYHKTFLKENLRPDGRTPFQVRPTVVTTRTVKTANSSALIKIGNSSVLCGIKLEVGVPQSSAPRNGELVVSVNLSPVCSPKFTIGRPSEYSQHLGEFLTNIVLSTSVFDLSELCIAEANSIWVIYADIVCIDYSGNILDACLLALVSALKDLKLPETELSDEGEVLITGAGQQLTVNHSLIPLTFGVIDQYLVADPDVDEEDTLESVFTVIYNSRAEFCTIYKPGGVPVLPQELRSCLPHAKKRVVEVLELFSADSARLEKLQDAD